MTRCPHPLLRYPLAFLFVVAAWFLLVPALDMPVQELQGNVLLSATGDRGPGQPWRPVTICATCPACM